MKRIYVVLPILIIVFCAQAQIKMPSIFDDNMILQQNAKVALWGKATPGKTLTVNAGWSNKKYKTVVAQDSLWKVHVETPPASFIEYNITIRCGKEHVINHVLIGEVWFCGGQSNMEMPMKGFINQPTTGSFNDILNSENKYLRCYTLKRLSSIKKQWDCPGKWESASPSTTPNFTATGYYFARLLQKMLNVPVAILHCSWGGSTIEAWMSPEAMTPFPELPVPRVAADNKVRHKTPTVLYNGMLSSILGYGIKGCIWYQGESNRILYDRYIHQFEEMHKDWIQKWDIGDFPIYFAQLAPFAYEDKRWNCAFMREAQQYIADTQPNTGMAVLMDVGDEFCIHPANKKEVGERLGYIALAKKYGYNTIEYQSPAFDKMVVRDTVAHITFRNAPNGITSFGKEITGFKIAGEDKIFYPAHVKLTRKTLEISSPKVPNPKAVRYAFEDYALGSLFGVNGLPISSFRTDNWNDVK